MSSDVEYNIRCDECGDKLDIRFSRNRQQLIVRCSNCLKTFDIKSDSLELSFLRNYFRESNGLRK